MSYNIFFFFWPHMSGRGHKRQAIGAMPLPNLKNYRVYIEYIEQLFAMINLLFRYEKNNLAIILMVIYEYNVYICI